MVITDLFLFTPHGEKHYTRICSSLHLFCASFLSSWIQIFFVMVSLNMGIKSVLHQYARISKWESGTF
jgi:hypothetical protein